MGRNEHELPGELETVGRRLLDERPEATALELDRIKQRAIKQASAAGTAWAPRKGLFMKPRIAVVAMLSLGLLMSGSGATLAVMSDSDDASKVQYPDLIDNKGKDEVGDVLGSEESGSGPSDVVEDGGGSAPSGGDGSAPNGGDDSAGIQEERQVGASGGGELPFTGFLAIPLLIAGVMLLVAGGVMRTRTRADD